MPEEIRPGMMPDPSGGDDWAGLWMMAPPSLGGSDELIEDCNVWVVKITLTKKDNSGTVTYYLSRDYYDAGELYSGSPVIYPVLAGGPDDLVAERSYGREIAIIHEPIIRVYGKSHFDDYNKSFFDLSDEYRFHEADVEIRAYTKSQNGLTTHVDSVNIRMGRLKLKNFRWDGEILELGCRQSLFKEKEISKRLEAATFTDLEEDYEGEYGAIVFGRDVVVEAPWIESTAAVTGQAHGEVFLSWVATGHNLNAFDTFYARNTEGPADPEWVDIGLSGVGVAIHGTQYETGDGDAEGGLFESRGVVFSPGPDDARILWGINTALVRTATAPEAGSGLMRIFIARAVNLTAAGAYEEERILREIKFDQFNSASLLTTLSYIYPPLVATPNENYLIGVEWTSKGARIIDNGEDTGTDYVVDNATITGQGQEFSAPNQTTKLVEMRFRLKIGGGTPTGDITAELYDSDDASPAAPTGSVLGTSDGVDSAVLTASYQEYAFHFSTDITLNPTQEYFAVIRHASGSGTNYVNVDGASSGSDNGNRAEDNSGWTGDASSDIWFKVKAAEDNRGYRLRIKQDGTDSNDNAQVRDNSIVGATWASSNEDPMIALYDFQQGASGFVDTTGTAPSKYSYYDLTADGSNILAPSFYSDNSDGKMRYEVELKAKVNGLEDDGSGTYTGTPSAVIENPSDIIRFILLEDEIGIGEPSANLDLTTFTTARNELSDNYDMAFALEGQVFATEFVRKILQQARIILCVNRQGQICLEYPKAAASSADHKINEGYWRDEMDIVSINEGNGSQVLNDFEVPYAIDKLSTPKDVDVVRRLGRDASYSGVEVLNDTTSTAGDAGREAAAATSKALYGRRTYRETFDLYGAGATGPRNKINYTLDRYGDRQTTATIRIPYKDFSTADQFDSLEASSWDLPSALGSNDCITWWNSGSEVTWYDDGVPVKWHTRGKVSGLITGIREFGDDIEITIETAGSF